MKDNPFHDAASFTFKERLSDKLIDLGYEWDIATDDGKNASDDELYALLVTNNSFEEIYYDYIAAKEGNQFDPKTLHETVERWVITNG